MRSFDLVCSRLLLYCLGGAFVVLYLGPLPPGFMLYPGCPSLPCLSLPFGSCVVGGVAGLDGGLLVWWVFTRPP